MIAIVDYGMGNIGSVRKAFAHAGAQTFVADTPEALQTASAIALPGVGAFPPAMRRLAETGLARAIIEAARKGKPLLGICLGYQLLFDSSDEDEPTEGLALIPGEVKRFTVDLKTPHIGWNSVTPKKRSPLTRGIVEGDYFYFVHSYYAVPRAKEDALLETEYGIPFASAAARENIFGTQFHPEKSQEKGLTIIGNFTEAACG